MEEAKDDCDATADDVSFVTGHPFSLVCPCVIILSDYYFLQAIILALCAHVFQFYQITTSYRASV